MTPSTYCIQRAILSVSDKTALIPFARFLQQRGIILYSTGGTFKTLQEAGLAVLPVSELTNFPEILDGRVKTLHPAVHAGLLAKLDDPEHVTQLATHRIESIDLLVVNLYPFEKTVIQTDKTQEEIIEQIDIGGPAMIRASAKNYRWTAVVTNPQRYADVQEWLEAHNGAIPEKHRLLLAKEAFSHTALYDSMIAQYFSTVAHPDGERELPEEFSQPLRLAQALRYGENPHQQAGLYSIAGRTTTFFSIFQQVHGKELSYNNILDITAASHLALEFYEPQKTEQTVVIVKHTNPCGVATAKTLSEAYRRAYECDTTSAFGGIIAFTDTITIDTARVVDELFTEVLIAPAYSPEALELLQKKKNRRLMTINFKALQAAQLLEIKSVAGGILLQTPDDKLWNEAEKRVVSKRLPEPHEQKALEYAWKIAKHVKSNAVVYTSESQLLAVGAGQMSRVDSAAIAVQKAKKAGISLQGSAVASDAFFPFADGLLEAVAAGATAVIQPGGSVRDEEVIEAANNNNITMIFTGMRHFRH